MSLNQCDRVARCDNNVGHEGPCSEFEPFHRLVSEIYRWKNTDEIQRQGSLQWWIKEELETAREALDVDPKTK
jgi:hypothetical protein